MAERATIFDRLRRRRRLWVYPENGEKPVMVSLKGFALLCAIDAGMIQATSDGSFDDEPFLRFWDDFSKSIPADRRGYPGELQGVVELRKKEKCE